jgi:hypothetical protein
VAQRRPADAGLTDPARRLLLAAAAVLPAACAGSGVSGPAGPVAAPRVRIGDRWRYQLVDRLNGRWLDEPSFEVVAVAPEIVMRVTSRKPGPPREERFTGAWSARVEWMYGADLSFDDPVPLLPSPIAAGGRSSTVTRYREGADPRRHRWTQSLSARGWEAVEVPAGRYECLRVERTIGFTSADTTGRGVSSRTDTLWYAPAVNRWVQREWRGDFVSAGLGDNPAEGILAMEDRLLWQLTAYVPTPTAR